MYLDNALLTFDGYDLTARVGLGKWADAAGFPASGRKRGLAHACELGRGCREGGHQGHEVVVVPPLTGGG
jgi:hypothetical protein